MHRDLKSDNVALALPVAAMMASSCSAPALVSVAPTAEAAMRSPSSCEATEPSACIIDFGMARAFDVLDHDNDLAAHVMETDIAVDDDDDDSDEDAHFPVRAVSERVSIPMYCAPEIALSHGLYDSKADMWAGD